MPELLKKTLLLIVFAYFITITIFSSKLVQAVEPNIYSKGSIGLHPAYSDVVLEKPNEEKFIDLFFLNNSDKPISLDISAIDFKQKDLIGIVTFLGENSKDFSYSLASFLSFETNRLDIEPNQEKKLKVFVKNRDDVSPGGHYAAVIGRLIEPQGDAHTSYVSPSVSSLIYLEKKGGERFKIVLKDLSWPSSFIAFGYPDRLGLTFSNDGNIHLIPYGRLEIKDTFGRLLYRGVVNSDSARILPETRRIISVDLIKTANSLPFSVNTISVSGTDSLNKVSYSDREAFIYIDPILLVILAFGFIIYIRYRFIREKKKK